MDLIKEAFSKIKEDINELRREILDLNIKINQINKDLQTAITPNTAETYQQTDQQTNKHSFNYPLYSRESPRSIPFSTGNRGVPTDRQTNQQTNKPTLENNPITSKNPISEFKRANEVLSSLDGLKQEIRAKFKRLTPQEMLVFSTLYGLEEQKTDQITYKTLADRLNLSESSIRDYINKLLNKGIPIDKIRLNNKIIVLKVSNDLKSIAPLSTIINLMNL